MKVLLEEVLSLSKQERAHARRVANACQKLVNAISIGGAKTDAGDALVGGDFRVFIQDMKGELNVNDEDVYWASLTYLDGPVFIDVVSSDFRRTPDLALAHLERRVTARIKRMRNALK